MSTATARTAEPELYPATRVRRAADDRTREPMRPRKGRRFRLHHGARPHHGPAPVPA